MRQNNFLRWISFLSGILILVVTLISHNNIDDLSYVIWMLLAIAASLLSLFRKYWWLLPLGILFVIGENDYEYHSYPIIIYISAIILFFTPFMNIALRRKD